MTTLKEKYEYVKYVLEKIRYDQHKWLVCVDVKMTNFCWDTRDTAQHYLHKEGLAYMGGIGALPSKERHQQSSGRQRQDTVSTAAHQTQLD